VNEITIDRPRESARVRLMARFFFAVFWTIVFTGAIRKWIFPGMAIFYLTQDVPIALSYLFAIGLGIFNRGVLFLGLALLSAVITLQALVQIVISGLDPFVAFVGLHNYLFYLPIILVFPLCLTLKYRKDFVWWNLIFTIPMCLLAIVQSRSPRLAWVNRTSEGAAFGLPGTDVARVSGTFNFVSFYSLWVGIAVALCMGEWLLPRERRSVRKLWLLILCTFTVNVCHLVSGSRMAILLSCASILGAIVGAIVLGSTRALTTLIGMAVFVPVAAGLTILISPKSFDAVATRFTGETYQADAQYRVIDGLIGFATIPPFTLVGAGVGLGVDAAHVGSSEAYNFTYQLSEGDLARIVMEAGTPVGLFYVLTRILFGAGMILLAVRIVRAGASPHVLPLSFILFAQMYLADMTRNAAMSASQVMVGYAFILGAFYYPDNIGRQEMAIDSLARSA
jgi:hypothetical protein